MKHEWFSCEENPEMVCPITGMTSCKICGLFPTTGKEIMSECPGYKTNEKKVQFPGPELEKK